MEGRRLAFLLGGAAALGVAAYVALRLRRASRELKWAHKTGAVAGGHDDSIRFKGDRLLKKQQDKGRGEREAKFLELASRHPFLNQWVPTFYGVRELDGSMWIEMSNLTAGFGTPAVLDLKLGTQTWTPGSTPAKRRYHEDKARKSTSLKLGVRVTGGKIRSAFGGELESVGSKMKREVKNEAELRDCLDRYLCSDPLRRAFYDKMQALQHWFSTQREFHFFGTSVLLAFDAAVEVPTELRVVLIDFPHVHDVSQVDTSCLTGARTLHRMAEQIVARAN